MTLPHTPLQCTQPESHIVINIIRAQVVDTTDNMFGKSSAEGCHAK